MGTRADFYIGNGTEAEWLGSVAWDGYLWDDDKDSRIAKASTDDEFRATVAEMLAGREDATLPDMGWPWPWNDSKTTDYAYCFKDGKMTTYRFGGECYTNEEGERDSKDEKTIFPNMEGRKNVNYGNRSGAIFVSVGG